MPFCLSGGIGLSVESPLDLPKSWKEALAALENAIFMGEEKISLFSESLLPQNYDLLYPVQEERRLFALLALGDREQISREQKAFFTLLAQYPLSESMIRQTALSFVKQLLLYRADHLPLADVDAAEMSRKIDTLIHSASLDELERNLTRIFADILDAQTKLPAANAYVREAIRYIEANYQDPINLHSVASALNLSPTYLSALFKQEMNINFIDYLNHYRMDKAKALLSTRGKRIYEVASDVGLQDEKYFFKLFKRYTGLTPAQYRDSMHLMDSV